MRKILLLSAALMAILAGPAMAQRGGDHGRGGGRPAATAPHAAPQAAPGNRAQAGRQSMQRQQAQRSQFAQRGGDHRSDFNRGGDRRGSDHRGGFNRNDNHRPDFNRGHDRRGNDRFDRRGGFRGHTDWSRYHRSFNAPRRFHFRGGVYHRPPGFRYRRWSFGDFLPSLYWGSSYWINDFYYYDLMPPPAGTVWVRYGDDAVLIDRVTGEVIQVEYGIFF
jgi:Ni/Co efflux regulator RcnB